MEDGTSWITNYANKNEQSFSLKLVDAGYDVWIGNNRGTMYSWGHKTLDAAVDAEYWDWTWADMGLYDDPANINMIKAATGEDKIFYIGYSQGTGQMHYALAKNEKSYHVNNLHKVVHMAPCFIPDVPDLMKSKANTSIMTFRDNGIYAINGPNWTADLQQIKDVYGFTVGKYFEHATGSQGQGVKSEQYWLMNGLIDRFQEFDDEWLTGSEETTLVDVSQITELPMTFFVARDDLVCKHSVAQTFID